MRDLNSTQHPNLGSDRGKLASGKSNDVENPFWAPRCNIMSVLYLHECKLKALLKNGVSIETQAQARNRHIIESGIKNLLFFLLPLAFISHMLH